MLAKTVPQPTPNTAVAKPAYRRHDDAPPRHAVDAVRSIEAVLARGPERRGAAEARERDPAQNPTGNIVVLDRGTEAARRQSSAVAGRASTVFLAQRIAQEEFSGSTATLESPAAAYAATAGRETFIFGLQSPLDITV